MWLWGCKLWLIPTDPEYVPPPKARRDVVRLLRRFAPQAGDIDVILLATPVFYEGEDWTRWGWHVHCPHCGTDLTDWWPAALDAAYDRTRQRFRMHAVAPCCSRPISLNDLEFGEESGF